MPKRREQVPSSKYLRDKLVYNGVKLRGALTIRGEALQAKIIINKTGQIG